MTSVRLLPILIIVSLAFLALKLGEVMFYEGVPSHGQAMAQDKPAEDAKTKESAEKVASVQEGKAEDKKPEHAPGKVSSVRPTEFMSSRENAVPSQSEIEVLKSLRERRQSLDKREEQLRLRENLLKAAEKRLEKRVGELKEIESNIEKVHLENEEKSRKGMESLVSMYSNMKPKDAARIFNTLDMEVLVSLVDQMNARKMSPVLAKMNPKIAKSLTVEIAERLKKKNDKAKEKEPLPSIPEK